MSLLSGCVQHQPHPQQCRALVVTSAIRQIFYKLLAGPRCCTAQRVSVRGSGLAVQAQEVDFPGLRSGGSRPSPGHLLEVLPQLLCKFLTALPLQQDAFDHAVMGTCIQA